MELIRALQMIKLLEVLKSKDQPGIKNRIKLCKNLVILQLQFILTFLSIDK